MSRPRRSGGRVSNGLVALGTAAVLTIYSAGYLRTRAAAERLAERDLDRPRMPAPPEAGPPVVMPEPPPAPRPVNDAPTPKPKVTPKAAPAASVPDAPAHVASKPSVAQPADAQPADAKPADTKPIETKLADVKPVETTTAEVKPADAPPPAASPYKDGTYYGWGTSRHGDIQASVVIHEGRITGASISQCLTRYSCSWIAHLQGQVVTRQSAEVDYVSGATQSTNAFYYAILEALSKAK